MKIKEIKFKSFRTYKDETFVIPEDKNIILLYARNGFGKTSFFDGIEWGLTGRLLRYEERSGRERNEYPILRNSFSERLENDGVEIIFNNDTSVKRFIKNDTSDYGRGILHLNGNEVNSLTSHLVKESYQNKIEFERSFNFSQLLSQDLISNFIRHTSDPDRYRTVVNLFGLDSYKNYDEHIQNTKQRIKIELAQVESDIQSKNNELKVEEARLSNIDIDEKIMISELEKLYQNEIEIQKLEEYQEHFSNLNITTDFENNKIKEIMMKLQYVKNNYDVNEKVIEEYNSQKENINSLLQFINLFSKKKYFENVIENLSNYNLYLEQKQIIEENKEKINRLYKELNTNPFFQEVEQKDIAFKNLASYKTNFKTKVDSYFESKTTIELNDNSINTLITSLEGLCSLKNKLLHNAKDFFELNENKDLEICPVCENKFDIDVTVEKIEQQLNTDLKGSDFSEINHSISQLKENNKKLKEQFAREELQLFDMVNDIKNEVKEEYAELIKQSIEFDILKESHTIVIDNLALLKIELEAFEREKSIYFDELKKHKEYKINGSEEYYQKLYEEKKQSLDILYSEIQSYIQSKEDISFVSIQILNQQIKEKQELINLNSIKIRTYAKALNLISSLENYFADNEILENIVAINESLSELHIKSDFLNQVNLDYTNLKDAVKITIDGKTKELLAVYQETIEKIYHYLNPNVYMRNLTIRKTEEGVNRLVFEVSSDESDNKHSPSYIFSSAQNNVLALSIFLSFAIKQQWSELDAIFLDDPIQNMDDINIHSFVDLIRSIGKQQTGKQFFISTHDERIYKFMLNKFGEDNVHSFTYEDYGVLAENNSEVIFPELTLNETTNEPL